MSHPLRQDEARRAEPLTRPWAAVRCRLEGTCLVLDGDLFVAKSDSLWVELPERFDVVTAAGHPLRPSGGRRFFISVETFSPFHAVLEAPAVPLPRLRETA